MSDTVPQAVQQNWVAQKQQQEQHKSHSGMEMPRNRLYCILGIVLFVILFISAFLIGFSFRVVDYDEYGLKYNQVNRQIEPGAVYEAGRHFIGLGNNFYRFKKTFQNIEFSERGDTFEPFNIRATDGQSIIIELSFQYRIRKAEVHLLYTNYKFSYHEVYARIAKGRLRDVASVYSSQQFFDERDTIEIAMKNAVNEELGARHADLVGFQLRQIILPESLDQLLLNIQLTIQESRKSLADLTAKTIRTETEAVVRSLQADKNNLIATLQTETEKARVEISKNVSSIQEETRRLVKTIQVRSQTEIAVYRQETENQRLELQSNKTIIEETTEQLEQEILRQTDVLQAEADATIAAIRATAEAKRIDIVEAANTEAASLEQQVQLVALSDVAQQLRLSAEEANTLQYIEMLRDHSSSKLLIDLYSPTQIMLPGQREAYFQATAATTT